MTEWKDDAESRERVRKALDAIDQEQAHLPQCVFCGQRVNRPDVWGLCSKVSDPHRDYRDTRTKRGAA